MSEAESKMADLIAKGRSLEDRRRQFTEPKRSVQANPEAKSPPSLRGEGGCGCRKFTKRVPPPIPPIVPGGYGELPTP